MKLTMTVPKAEAIGGQEVPDLELHIGPDTPERHAAFQDMASDYEDDAERIADALAASLPGGTMDRLLGILLARKASHFIVPWAKFAAADDQDCPHCHRPPMLPMPNGLSG